MLFWQRPRLGLAYSATKLPKLRLLLSRSKLAPRFRRPFAALSAAEPARPAGRRVRRRLPDGAFIDSVRPFGSAVVEIHAPVRVNA